MATVSEHWKKVRFFRTHNLNSFYANSLLVLSNFAPALNKASFGAMISCFDRNPTWNPFEVRPGACVSQVLFQQRSSAPGIWFQIKKARFWSLTNFIVAAVERMSFSLHSPLIQSWKVIKKLLSAACRTKKKQKKTKMLRTETFTVAPILSVLSFVFRKRHWRGVRFDLPCIE